ncbi:allene oxide cyclase barrel-like domain-containing protein [Streptomyces sp. IBSNAI002]|uniref:allene oxide cyclase barrel-like domain-containing protein n=1 Tax=Streptomyces sp. IBSNAI002 TaxID=3457500 RepID=UPI003FD40C32
MAVTKGMAWGTASLLFAGWAAWSQAAPNNSVETHHVIAEVTQDYMIDTGDKGRGPGDVLTRSADILQDGEKIGVSGVQCTMVAIDKQTKGIGTQCVGTLLLDDGKITFQNLDFNPGGPPKESDSAITGGTQEYEGVRGSLHVVRISPTTEEVTLRLRR